MFLSSSCWFGLLGFYFQASIYSFNSKIHMWEELWAHWLTRHDWHVVPGVLVTSDQRLLMNPTIKPADHCFFNFLRLRFSLRCAPLSFKLFRFSFFSLVIFATWCLIPSKLILIWLHTCPFFIIFRRSGELIRDLTLQKHPNCELQRNSLF